MNSWDKFCIACFEARHNNLCQTNLRWNNLWQSNQWPHTSSIFGRKIPQMCIHMKWIAQIDAEWRSASTNAIFNSRKKLRKFSIFLKIENPRVPPWRSQTFLLKSSINNLRIWDQTFRNFNRILVENRLPLVDAEFCVDFRNNREIVRKILSRENFFFLQNYSFW